MSNFIFLSTLFSQISSSCFSDSLSLQFRVTRDGAKFSEQTKSGAMGETLFLCVEEAGRQVLFQDVFIVVAVASFRLLLLFNQCLGDLLKHCCE